ncbi:MAG: ABC transporter ATP-binding protein [Deltaproteobacteria bacterium]|nr:ABC transporter ATP-binding protein [Deltaproteobacteria bacterium]
MTQPTIELKELTKYFSGKNGNRKIVALDHFSLSIAPGEFVCLLGPSGCGKTTALRCLAGFEVPNSGEIFVDGKEVTRTPAHLRGLPLVFQNYALFPHMTVSENVAYGLKVRGIRKQEREPLIIEVLKRLGLEGLGDRHPDQLSGGQQQRVALARALVLKPSILLFDEPLSNLDSQLRLQMREEIKKLHREFGMTCLYVTHHEDEAIFLSDRMVMMKEGRVEEIETPSFKSGAFRSQL